MAHKSSHPKTAQDTSPEASQTRSAGPAGVALTPPAYGYDFLANVPGPTGLPAPLKTGIEGLSGLALDDVRVHYNSSRPARLQALAFTRGTEIHIAPGQERHLPHEAWHVVQQAQGRVKPDMRLQGLGINADGGLEREAEGMGIKAWQKGYSETLAARELSQPKAPASRGPRHEAALQTVVSYPDVVQLYTDLKTVYGGRDVGLGMEEKAAWLKKFGQIQELLNNTERVKTHLEALAAFMIRHDLSLDQALRNHEANIWTSAQPILTDFVPAPAFEDIVRRGQLFVDLVGKTHGVQTHRLQWYLVRAEFGTEFVSQVFPESVNPRWKVGGKNMWDLIVDETGAKDGDFTQPDKLEDFLLKQFEELGSHSDLGKLAGAVHAGHESQREDKTAMKSLYPPESAFTKKLRKAETAHRKLKIKQAELNQKLAQYKGTAKEAKYKSSHDQVTQELLRVEASIIHERVIHTSSTKLGGRFGGEAPKTYIWTGWIPASSSQAPDEATTYFIPTVAYPDTADPDELAKVL